LSHLVDGALVEIQLEQELVDVGLQLLERLVRLGLARFVTRPDFLLELAATASRALDLLDLLDELCAGRLFVEGVVVCFDVEELARGAGSPSSALGW